MENSLLLKTLYNDIQVTTENEINDTLIFALKLLHSLTRNIKKPMYVILKSEVSDLIFNKKTHVIRLVNVI